MCTKLIPLIEREHDFICKVLSLNPRLKPLITKTEDGLKFEYTLVDGKLDPKLDVLVKEFFERDGDWKWYAQGTTFSTGVRDICFSRVRLASESDESKK